MIFSVNLMAKISPHAAPLLISNRHTHIDYCTIHVPNQALLNGGEAASRARSLRVTLRCSH